MALTALVLAAAICLVQCAGTTADDGGAGDATPPAGAGDALLAHAFEDRLSGLEVEGQGTVVRVLKDDTEGGRHQRFIVRLASGQTLLVAHNIDVAPRVEDLRVGDIVAFRGEYEWNAEGGTIHWTHHDPEGDHTGGWIRHRGRTYE